MAKDKVKNPELKPYKMVQATHLHSTLESYISTWKDTYRARVKKLIPNIDDIAIVPDNQNVNMEVDLKKLRAIESDCKILTGVERKVKKNFVTATLNLIGLSKVQGIDLTGIKTKSY